MESPEIAESLYTTDPEIILDEGFVSRGDIKEEDSRIIGNEEISLDEAAKLGSMDGIFYSHYFFPKTARQDSAPFHTDVWDILDDPFSRLVGLQIFRGGSKTSILRLFTSRRIAYGLSNTILYIGKSEGHAVRSVEWLKRHIEFNPLFRQAFRLEKGLPWATGEIDIHHKAFDYRIRVLGMGITGSVRGVNIDDYRPDLIILDDVIDDENAATAESRQKINELIFGAVQESLAPETENPHAKMVMLQTPIAEGDASEIVQKDPDWTTLKVSCFTGDQSSWKARWSTKTLLKEKAAAARKNMLSVWLREKECQVSADETRYFSWENVGFWDLLPKGKLVTAIGIDPSPPKDEAARARMRKDPDPEVLAVVGTWGNLRYVLEYVVITDPDPEKSWIEFKRLARKWKVRGAGIESVAYQATLKWYFERKMLRQKFHILIHNVDDKREKTKRIRQRFVDLSVDNELFVHESMHEFKTQFVNYPDVPHEDVLDAIDIGFNVLLNYELGAEGAYNEEEYEELDEWRACP